MIQLSTSCPTPTDGEQTVRNPPRTVGSLTPLCPSHLCPCTVSVLRIYSPFFNLSGAKMDLSLLISCSSVHRTTCYMKPLQQQDGE